MSAELRSLYDHPKFATKPPVDGGGEPPHDGGMDARLDRLESRVDRLADQVGDLRVDVAGIKAKLSHMATKEWVLAGFVAVLVAVIGGFVWIAQQYLIPILHAHP